MHYRELGSTGLKVSEIGMGCNRLGEAQMPDSHWVDLVHAAIDQGVTLYDTCEAYGWGRSEEILGLAIGNNPDVLVADKVSRIQETNEKDFTSTRVLQRAELSLRRLQRDRIDIFQLHSPGLEQLQSYDWPEAMRRLKEQGKIRVSGVSINDVASGEWLVADRLVDMIQVSYNLLEPGVGDAIFPLAAKAGVGVLVRVPMAQGILTGKFRPGQDVPAGHRAHMAGPRMAERIESAERFRSIAEELGLPMATMALRYALTPEGVSAAIPGARTLQQLQQNVAGSNGFGLELGVVERIGAVSKSFD